MSAAAVLEVLRTRGETLATAESLTGGRLASLVTDVPGASAAYVGGVVSYATSVKTDVLGVPATIVEQHGVVSGECAQAMALGVRRLLGADWAVATTGVAGPTEQEGQPVGTVWVGYAMPHGTTVSRLVLDGDRDSIRQQTCERALTRLATLLTG